ncbi:hypothetical protein [Bosea sp. AAP35]|uniref:hypothetical protein n=1 Tax=Bosea sp. AAP35 TaxID=1523417 RepID=UPI0006B952D8|nr:hypothetical protein [Bosea sp. AAP35]
MRPTITLAALALLAGPVLAAGETPFEKAGGWEIERGARGTSCLMSKSYKDANDDDAVNALVFAVAADKAIMTFIYEHWTWDKDEKIRVPFVLDKLVAIPQSAWVGDGTSLTAELPNSIVPRMLAAKTMVLKLDGADADFDLAGFPQAYESLIRCENTPKAAATATESTHIVKAMTFPGDGDVPPQSAFATDTAKIVLALQIRNLKPDDKLTATWVAEKTDRSPPNFEIVSSTIPLGASQLVSASLSKPNAGWPPGRYRIDMRINGGPVEFRQYFEIEGSK